MAIFIAVQSVGLIFLRENINLLQLLSEVLGLGLPVLLYMLLSKRIKTHGFFEKVKFKNILLISLVTLLTIPVSMLVASFNVWLVENTVGLTKALDSVIELKSFSDYLIAIGVMAIAPAICEELAFRTIFFSGLGSLGKKRAFILVSLFFSLAHAVPEKLLSTFLLSILLCYFLYRTGSIWASVTAHFVNNFAAITISYIAGMFTDTSGPEESIIIKGVSQELIPFIFWGILSAMVIPMIVILLKKFHNNTKATSLNFEKSEKFSGTALAAFLPALAFYLILLGSVILSNILIDFPM